MRIEAILLLVCLLASALADTATDEKKEEVPAAKPEEKGELSEVKQREKDLKAFEDWFKMMIGGRDLLTKQMKVVPREIPQAGMDRDVFRGMYLTEDVKEGDPILLVPWHLMITTEKIANDNPELVSLYRDIELTEREALAVFLIYLKHCKPELNMWTTWSKTLPTKLNNILYFTQDELNLLGSSFLAKRGARRQKQSQKVFETLSKSVFPVLPGKCNPVTSEDWKWAESIVDSRALDLVNEATDEMKFSAIAPYFDFLNHENLPEDYQRPSWGYHSGRLQLHVAAHRDYSASDQAFIAYGLKCNAELVEKYGFFQEDNEYACVHLYLREIVREIDDNKTDHLREQRREALHIKSMDWNDYSLQILPAGSFTQELIDTADLVTQQEGYTVAQNTLAKYRWLLLTSQKQLARLPKTIAEDDTLIASSAFAKISKRARMAIKLRREEKKVLTEVIKRLKKAIEGLAKNLGEIQPSDAEATPAHSKNVKEEL